jgi:transcriptional regulator with XRE-family HTH domain
MAPKPGQQQRDLGAFLRSHRERVAPLSIGLPAGPRRRTPGLRREEVAQLAGVSATWYSWIEQGREVSASSASLARIAGVLRLGRAERAYLFALAGKRDPDAPGGAGDALPAAAKEAVAAIRAPAYILDRYWNARAWNAPAERLFTGWLDRPGERNLLRFIFLEPASRALIERWEERARRVAAEFRASSGTRRDDPALRRLIEALHRDSAPFARFWDEQQVIAREGGARRFDHPKDGRLHFEQLSFDLAADPDFKLTILTPRRAARAKRKRPS